MSTDLLSKREESALTECEAVIQRNISSFHETGEALMQIRDERLYRAEFKTFEEYCQTRWLIGRRTAYQFIDSAQVLENVRNCAQKPANEAQTRPLTKLPPEQQADAWTEAVETAPKGIVTAKHVEQIVNRRINGKRRNQVTAEAGAEICESLTDLLSTGRKFGAIYIDPPWQYGNQSTRAATNNHYGTMSFNEIAALPVADLAAEQCHLHLWTTNGFLEDALRLMRMWGFEFKSTFVWVKPEMGIGNYWRCSHEILLLGVKGKLVFNDHSLKSWAEFKRGEHSAKPDAVAGFIQRASPGPYLEMFARRSLTGWTVWGNEVETTLIA